MILLSVGVSILFCIFVEVLIVIGSINLNFNLLTSLLFVSQNLLSIIWFLLLQMKVPLSCVTMTGSLLTVYCAGAAHNCS